MLEDLGNLGDFAGGIAVVVTLVYLASQIRQNTNAMRMTSQQEVAASAQRWVESTMDPNVRRAYAIGLRDFPDMTADEKGMFATVFSHHANHVQIVVALYQAGALDRETFVAHLTGLACHINTPGGARLWEEQRDYYPQRLVDALEERIVEGGLPEMLNNAFYQLDDRPA
jgi:hypothetical protein